MLGLIIQVDQSIILWVSRLVGESALLDRIMMVLASDYFVPACISLILLFLWFQGRDFAERDKFQRAVICAAISMGSAMGFVLAANHIWRHPHPFQDMPQLLGPATDRIFYPIHDPSFPSSTSSLTFAAVASIWQFNRKWGLILLIPAMLMPLAKLYAAVYYPSDIIGGAILGILTAYFIGKLVMPVLQLPIAIGVWVLRTLRLG